MKRRATAVIVEKREVLLVQDIGDRRWSLLSADVDPRRDLIPKNSRYASNCPDCRALNTAKSFSTPGACSRRGHGRPSGGKAVKRAIHEELRIPTASVRHLFDHYSAFRKHSVYAVELPSRPSEYNENKLSGTMWWNGRDVLPLRDSTRQILERAGFLATGFLNVKDDSGKSIWRLLDKITIGMRFMSGAIGVIAGIASLMWWLNRAS